MNAFLDQMRLSTEARIRDIKLCDALSPNRLDFMSIFSARNPVIAEIKFASPSQGWIYSGNLNHVAIAEQYLHNNAVALSVLTEPEYFKGDIHYIADIRAQFPSVPILLKDFIVSPEQIRQALQFGANAILLIVNFLSIDELSALYYEALQLGLTPIIEVSNVTELQVVARLLPKVILVNNRNLQTQKIDKQVSQRLISDRLNNTRMISASGIASRKDIQSVFDQGYDACLIGTALMLHQHPGVALQKLLAGKDNES